MRQRPNCVRLMLHPGCPECHDFAAIFPCVSDEGRIRADTRGPDRRRARTWRLSIRGIAMAVVVHRPPECPLLPAPRTRPKPSRASRSRSARLLWPYVISPTVTASTSSTACRDPAGAWKRSRALRRRPSRTRRLAARAKSQLEPLVQIEKEQVGRLDAGGGPMGAQKLAEIATLRGGAALTLTDFRAV